MNQVMLDALKVAGIGMGGVFIVLMLFFLMVKGLQRLFPYKDENCKSDLMNKNKA